MTEQTTHTPGPWHWDKSGSNIWPKDENGEDTGETIAEVMDPRNGPVIAAAPDLLAALEDAERVVAWAAARWTDAGPVLVKTRAAIAKATGREG
jgi:hypothetical protein